MSPHVRRSISVKPSGQSSVLDAALPRRRWRRVSATCRRAGIRRAFAETLAIGRIEKSETERLHW